MRKFIEIMAGVILIVLCKFVPWPETTFILFSPFFLQNFAVYFVTAVLGLWASISVMIVFILAILGFPVLLGNIGGLEFLLLPTAGFPIAWIFATLVIGSLHRLFFSKIISKGVFWFILGANIVGFFVILFVETLYIIITTYAPLYLALEQITQFIASELLLVFLASICAHFTIRTRALMMIRK